MKTFEKWRPSKELVSLKGSEKILAKDMSSNIDESDLDVPTFMRKSSFHHEMPGD
jgi:hypothetical protein